MTRRSKHPWALCIALSGCPGPGTAGTGDSATSGSVSGTGTTGEAPASTGPAMTGEAPTGEGGGVTDAVESSSASSGAAETGTGGKDDDPRCGDGFKQDTEECDEGANNADNAACTSQCKNAVCGDNHVYPPAEDCDNGPDNNDSKYRGCKTDCTWGPRCPDSHKDVGFEECDSSDAVGGVQCEGCRYVARMVFLTRDAFPGALGGIAGADVKCQMAAKSAGLDNDVGFRAWLSEPDDADPDNEPISPMTRFAHGENFSVYPYITPDGEVFAENFEALVAGIADPGAGIGVDEKGAPFVDEFGKPDYTVRAWTNTTAQGGVFAANMHCERWTSEVGAGRVGGPLAPSLVDWQKWWDAGRWTNYDDLECDEPAHLLCFEQ